MIDRLEDWLNFRRDENPQPDALTCIDCDKPAQGNVSCEDGDICDHCHETYTATW